jgi:HD-like signal output (HDOD) protein
MRLVLVDNEHRVADAHRRAFRTVRPEWDVVLAHDARAALDALDAAQTDVFIAELGKPPSDGALLFETVRDRWPSTVRIALSQFAEREIALRVERCAHRFIHKPCDTFALAMIVERCATLRAAIDDPRILEAIGGLEALPRPPLTVQALEKVLADPDAGVIAVSAVVSRDASLAARLLRVVNSSFFGISRQVTRVDAAVNFMGVSLVRAIAFADGAARSFRIPAAILDLDEWNTHAVRVGAAARDVVMAVAPRDRALADEAFLAGLLHDVGQLVLAGVTPAAWHTLEQEALRERLTIDEMEVRTSRTSHAFIGAYLLSVWGLPSSVVEAVAFHHSPERLPGTMFDAAMAVHIADSIVPRPPGRLAPMLHMPSVEGAGVSEAQLQQWRAQYNVADSHSSQIA